MNFEFNLFDIRRCEMYDNSSQFDGKKNLILAKNSIPAGSGNDFLEILVF